MNILCDENVKYAIFTLLRQEGYDVTRVQDALEVGFEDADIVAHCRATAQVLLTNDDDFFHFDDHPGIFFLADQGTAPRDAVTAIQRIERYVETDQFAGRVWHVPDGWL